MRSVVVLLALAGAAGAANRTGYVAEAERILRSTPLIDGHNDLAWRLRELVGNAVLRIDLNKHQPELHTDIPRLRAGRVGGVFWSVWVPCQTQGKDAVRVTLEQIDVVEKLVEKYPADFEIARTADDVERAFRAGKVASLLGMEGGHHIDASLPALRALHRAGVRYMTLTHTCNTPWAVSAGFRLNDDAWGPVEVYCADDIDCHPGVCVRDRRGGTGICSAAQVGGLTADGYGERVVREMNRVGMLIDVAHTAPQTMRDAIAASRAPVIYSHAAALTLCHNPRNVPDDVLMQLKGNGGVVMVVFFPRFVACASTATLEQVADHIDYIAKGRCPGWVKAGCGGFPGIGVEHVGFGSDFDGIPFTVTGLDSVDKFPDLVAELLRRGYTEAEVAGIAGGNVLRVLREAERVASALQHDSFPDETLVSPKRPCRTTDPAAKGNPL